MSNLEPYSSKIRQCKNKEQPTFTLSPGEYALWMEQQLYPDDISNHFHFVAKIQEKLDIKAFQKALWELAKRHDIIRTIFPLHKGQPVRQVLSPYEIKLEIIDCTQYSDKEVRNFVRKKFNKPFDLTLEIPYKFYLYKLSPSKFYFQMIAHHIAITLDGYVNLPITLAKLYIAKRNNEEIDEHNKEKLYSDFINETYGQYNNDTCRIDQDHWKNYVSNIDINLALPVDVKKNRLKHKNKVYYHPLDQELIINLKNIGLHYNSSLFSIMTAAFQAFLFRYTQQSEITVGIPISLIRNDRNQKTAISIGYTINILPLHSKISSNQAFANLLNQIKKDIGNMIMHRQFPSSMILEELNNEQKNKHSRLFNVLIISQRAKKYKEIISFGTSKKGIISNIEGFKYESIGIGFIPTGRFDLTLSIVENERGYEIGFHYNSAIFKKSTIKRWAENYLTLLQSIIDNPNQNISQLNILSHKEKNLLCKYNSTQTMDIPIKDFIELFQEQVFANSKNIAIEVGGEKIDYATLNYLSNQCANYLKNKGVKSGTLVGVILDRSLDLMVALLGIMKIGGAYLPIDPDLPKERIQFMLQDADVKILLSNQSFHSIHKDYEGIVVLFDKHRERIFHASINHLETNLDPNRLAYVIYTSGSTGQPKGVEIVQKSLNNLFFSLQMKLKLSSKDRWLALTSISFDIAHVEILFPLTQGARVVLAKREASQDPELLSKIIAEENQITFAQATPTTWQMLIEYGWKKNPRLKILCGGEALPKKLAIQLIHLSKELWNMYGPTETTIWSSMKKIEKEHEKITIGHPIANTEFYILDENKSILPIGIFGELYIGGIGLAKGYRNNLKLTNASFINTSLDGFQGAAILYRTGDIARYLPNGEIEYLKRNDCQVKINGYRIELEEIEARIRQCVGVNQAVVTIREERQGEKYIVAYFSGKCSISRIRKTLSRYLPKYMLPVAYMQLKKFPLTPNKKIDKKSLPMPKYFSGQLSKIAHSNKIEVEIKKIFEKYLVVKKIGINDNFFALGGNSLLVVRVMSAINRTFHINLPLKILFGNSNIASISKRVKDELKNSSSSKISKIVRQDKYDLSFSQQRVWFLDQLQDNKAINNIPFFIELSGNLDISLLQKSLEKIVQKHDILRTTFIETLEGPKQIIEANISSLLCYKDMSVATDPQSQAKKLIEEEANKPFDLINGPLFHFLLIKISNDYFLLFFNFHHIIFDGYSINILMNELKTSYEQHKEQQPRDSLDTDIQYFDYIYWQRNAIKQFIAEGQLSWWLEKLHSAPKELALPLDNPRPLKPTYEGASLNFSINFHTLKALKRLAQENESTLFMVLLSIFHVFLFRYTNENDMVIGVPINGRVQDSLNSTLGCFINTLAFRITSNIHDTFLDLLYYIRKESLKVFKRQDIPFEKLIENLKIDRNLNISPLFQVMFNFLSKVDIETINGLDIKLHKLPPQKTQFDLSLSFQETSKELIGTFEYNKDLFVRETIEQMSRHFQKLLNEILKFPEQRISKINFLSEAELYKQIIEWNQQSIEYPKNETILQSIEKWAEVTPNAQAIVFKDQIFSYHDVNVYANKIAHALLSKEIQLEDKVVVFLDRTDKFISTILGVLKSGGVYVPIDPMQPKERTLSLLKELKPFCILTTTAYEKEFLENKIINVDRLNITKSHNPGISILNNQLAYIIYTSGSTGKPKGVKVSHQSINDRVFWKKTAYPVSNKEVMLHTYSFIFDGAIINYFWPLCVGASLVITSKEEQFDTEALVRLIKKYNITTMDLLPSLLQGILEEPQITSCHYLKNVFVGGDVLSSEVVRLFYKKSSATLHNTYGPTEATVEASVWECDPNYSGVIAPIGKPIGGTKLYVLNREKNIVPIGVVGELHIGGFGLAEGYLNDPALTNEKFISDPFNDDDKKLMYSTGDLVKYQPDGNIAFIGRKDKQVKIRGYRIDLKEIESIFLRMDFIDQAVVVVKGEGLHKQIIAYVVLGSSLNEKVINQFMIQFVKKHLPEYMRPQHVITLNNIPTLLNGKIDYKALPKPVSKVSISNEQKCKNKTEKHLIKIWQQVLNIDALKVTDNFFEIGGNSLLAMRLMTRIRHELHTSLPLVCLFENPTIEKLSTVIKSNVKTKWSHLVSMKSGGNKQPFFCIHPIGGGILCYRSLVKYWNNNRPFYAIQAKGLDEGQLPYASIRTMAREYIKAIRQVQPNGPYLLGGWSFGGLVATEIVNQLMQAKDPVSLLILIDTTANIEQLQAMNIEDDSLLLSDLTHHFGMNSILTSKLSLKERLIHFIENGEEQSLNNINGPIDHLLNLAKSHYRALHKFSIPNLDVKVALIKTKENPEISTDLGWRKFARNLKVYQGPGNHWAITRDEYAQYYSKILNHCFESYLPDESISNI